MSDVHHWEQLISGSFDILIFIISMLEKRGQDNLEIVGTRTA